MSLTYTFENLKDTAQVWALQQVGEKHPIGDRDKSLDLLVADYEYNRFGDIIDYDNRHIEFEGLDPDYRDESDWSQDSMYSDEY